MEAFAYHKQLIALRHKHRALRRGRHVLLHVDAFTYTYARELDGEVLVISMNVGDEPAAPDVPIKGLLKDNAKLKAVFGAGETSVKEGSVKLSLPPREGVVLVVVE
jgi:glycosidase